MTRGRRTSLLVGFILAAAVLAAYLVVRTDWGHSRLSPAAADSCRGLPKTLERAFADAADCALLRRTLTQALATAANGAVTRWHNAKSGTGGSIKLAAAAPRAAAACRRAELAVTRAMETKHAEALACREDGGWTLVE